MIKRSPVDTDTTLFRIQTQRQARQIALRAVHLQEEEVARQLKELDDAILGTSARELGMLRRLAKR